jgi:hypothetical protein
MKGKQLQIKPEQGREGEGKEKIEPELRINFNIPEEVLTVKCTIP